MKQEELDKVILEYLDGEQASYSISVDESGDATLEDFKSETKKKPTTKKIENLFKKLQADSKTADTEKEVEKILQKKASDKKRLRIIERAIKQLIEKGSVNKKIADELGVVDKLLDDIDVELSKGENANIKKFK